MKQIFSNVSNRKLRVCAFVMLFGTVMWFVCKSYYGMDVTFGDWTDFTIWIIGLYFGGNVGEHGMKALKKQPEPEPNPAPVALEDR